MGGVATCVANKDSLDTLKVSEGANGEEYIVTRHNQFAVPLSIINVYGEEEGRTPVTEVQQRWENILAEVAKIEMRNELVILIGDMNKKVGNIIEGNTEKVS